MSRTIALLKVLFVSILVLLGVSHASNVSAGTNVWTSYGPEGGTINALAIDPLTPTILYAGTEGGGVFKSTNGGDNWSAVNVGLTSPRVRALAIDPLTPTTLYVGTWSGGVFKSTNAGGSWYEVNTGLTDTNVRALVIDPAMSGTLYAGSYQDSVFKSTNNGASWTAVSTGLPTNGYGRLGALAIDPATPATLYAGVDDDVFKTTNGGENWNPANVGLPAPNPIVCEIETLVIDPVTPTILYVGTWTCGVYKSTNGGASWRATNERLWGTINALAIDSQAATVYAGTDNGVFKSTNGGENWTEATTGLPAASRVASLAIDLAAPATVFVGLYYGGVAKSTEGGDNWRAANTGLTATVASSLAIDPKTPSTLYAGVDNGGVYKSIDSGRSWRAVNNGVWVHTYFHAVAIDPATPGTLYAANPHDLYRSTDGGGSWQTLDVDPSGHPWHRSIAIDPLTPNTLYVGAWGEGVFKSVNSGDSWSAMNAGLPDRADVWSLAIDPAMPSTLYAGMYGQGVYKSMDSGESWRSISNGLFDGNVVGVAIDPATPTILYAGTWFGGVFKSVDGGENWSEINIGLTDTAIRSLAIDPVTPSTLYVGTTSGVFKSTNGGANWITFNIGRIRSAVPSLAIDPMTPTTIYAGTEGGGVFEIQQVELKHRTYLPLVFGQSAAPPKPMKIAFFVSDMTNLFHQGQATEAQKYAKDKYGAEVFIFDGKSDSATMTENVKQMLAQGMEAASLHIWDYEAVKPTVQEALSKGIILTSFFSPLGDSGIPVARSDEATVSFAMGAEMAKQWKAANPDKPIVMVQLGWPNHSEVKSGRTDPFVKGVLSVDPTAKDLGCQDASKGADAARLIIKDLMTQHPEVNLIYSEAANLTVGTMAGLTEVGRGKMANGKPLTELVASADFDESEYWQVYDPNSSLKLSLGLPPIETGRGRIDLIMDVAQGRIPRTSQPAKEQFYKAYNISFWSMTQGEAAQWLYTQFGVSVSDPVPPYKPRTDKPKKIAFLVSDLTNPFHQRQATEAQKYAKDKYGAEVFVFDGKSDSATMAANVKQILVQDMDAASLHIWDYEAVKPTVREALGKGIVLTSFFSPLGGSGIPVARSDEAGVSFAMGAEMAKQWKAANPDKPIVMVELGWPNHTEVKSGRTDPFVKGVLSVDPTAKDLGCQNASMGPEAAKQIIKDLARLHPEVNLIYSEASNLTVGTMAGLAEAGRGKMENGKPLTEIVASADFDEIEYKQMYDPNSSLKFSMGLPPIETGQGRIDLIMDVAAGKIPMVSQPAKEQFYKAYDINYYTMTQAEAAQWLRTQFGIDPK